VITVRIPGPPFSQPRPKARAFAGHAQIYEPKEAKVWKGAAQVHMLEALRVAGLSAPAFPPDMALEVVVTAVFACPKGDYRRRDPIGRRPYMGLKDWDNVGKAVCDAGNGVLYVDDRYIARGTVECWVGAQDEAPYVELVVRALRDVDEYGGRVTHPLLEAMR
jgi:Holliday junction resolvase RusA-like endonuclease